MSTELKEAAEKALVVLGSATSFMSRKARDQHESVVAELRTAIQQAESEPVGEPRARVELMKTGGNAGLSTRIIELDIATRERLRPGDLLYTHPAPGVTDDVARDAERYRFIRDAGVSDDLIPDIALYAMESLDEYIDAAMLAASPAQKGGE